MYARDVFLGYGGASTNGIHTTCEFSLFIRVTFRRPKVRILTSLPSPSLRRAGPAGRNTTYHLGIQPHAARVGGSECTRSNPLPVWKYHAQLDAPAPVTPPSEAGEVENTRPSDSDTPSASAMPADGIITGVRSSGFARFLHQTYVWPGSCW